jgi:N-acetylneuraminate synthase
MPASVRLTDEISIGPDEPVFVIAEAGVNHNGDPALAHRLVDVAAECGADAVKFQSFEVDSLVTRAAPMAGYQRNNTGSDASQHAMLQALALPAALQRELQDHCRERNIVFLSSPFDHGSLELLLKLGVPALKMPSGELTNEGLLRAMARSGLPLLVSTGMATLEEVATALRWIEEEDNQQVVLLHCLSSYPADPAEVNLRAMGTLERTFDRPTGYSDHTLGIAVALAAVALGACALEKHFTLDHGMEGPDHAASVEPGELQALVSGVRQVRASLGDGVKRPQPSEQSTAAVARKSLVAARYVPAGTVLGADMIAVKRPGTGLAPASLPELVGRRTRRAFAEGELFDREGIVLSDEEE